MHRRLLFQILFEAFKACCGDPGALFFNRLRLQARIGFSREKTQDRYCGPMHSILYHCCSSFVVSHRIDNWLPASYRTAIRLFTLIYFESF